MKKLLFKLVINDWVKASSITLMIVCISSFFMTGLYLLSNHPVFVSSLVCSLLTLSLSLLLDKLDRYVRRYT